MIRVNSFGARLRIFMALLQRDLRQLRQSIGSRFVDSLCILVIQVLLSSKLFPLLGMPEAMILPIYLGAMFSFLMFFGFNLGLRVLFDLKFSKYINYQLTLPLPKRWLIAEYIVYFVIESLLITIPLLTLGLVLVGRYPAVTIGNLIWFFAVYLAAIVFSGAFFIFLCFWYPYNFYTNDLWPRRINLLFVLSANFLLWDQVNRVSPLMGKMLLLNPFTYGAEGMRSALLGGPFIPKQWCFLILLCCIFVFIPLITQAVKKRLDPV